MRNKIPIMALWLAASSAWAQQNAHDGHHGAHESTPAPAQESMPSPTPAPTSGMDPAAHSAMSAPATADEPRDPHAYADGYGFSQLPMRHEDMAMNYHLIRLDQLERSRTDDRTVTRYELFVSYGGDIDRGVIRADGEVAGGTLDEASTELLWSRAVAPFWNALTGLRYDSGEGPDRTWFALGIQGLAPYWFEVDATAYVGDQGRSAVTVEAEYELLFTQRLVLQPRIEATAYGQRDNERAIGPGLSSAAAGLRLRYEIRREFAPYIGVEWAATFGATAELARDAGDESAETRAVAGVRAWF